MSPASDFLCFFYAIQSNFKHLIFFKKAACGGKNGEPFDLIDRLTE
jgi:hypothetical protein